MPRKTKKDIQNDIEERITENWAEGVKDLDINNIRKHKKIVKDDIVSGAYNMIFIAKEKTAKAKLETNKRLGSKLWVANLVVASLAVFVFSVAITHFTPRKAKEIQNVFDKILLFPARGIKNLGVKYSLINPTCKKEETKLPKKADLANYIKHNQNKLPSDENGKILSVNIKSDDFGRVAGVQEVFMTKEKEFFQKTKEIFKDIVLNISEKQKNISFALENKLKTTIKNLKN